MTATKITNPPAFSLLVKLKATELEDIFDMMLFQEYDLLGKGNEEEKGTRLAKIWREERKE